MPPNEFVLVTIPNDNGLPEDATTNTWSFELAADSAIQREAYLDALQDFYESCAGLYSPEANVDAITFKVYDRANAKPRPVISQRTFDAGTSADDGLPGEVAVVLSFRSNFPAGSNRARRRGRIFLGPLALSWLDNTGATVQMSASFQDTLRDAASALLVASDLASGWTWDIWSEMDSVGYQVISGWVDNAFDTQRRRGREATSRITF
jgi:hypothetical protein